MYQALFLGCLRRGLSPRGATLLLLLLQLHALPKGRHEGAQKLVKTVEPSLLQELDVVELVHLLLMATSPLVRWQTIGGEAELLAGSVP